MSVHTIFRPLLDYFSGKPVDKPSDLLPSKNAWYLRTVWGGYGIERCPMCWCATMLPTLFAEARGEERWTNRFQS